MGSFYKTATPSWADNMIPEWDTNLMDQALAAQEKNLQKTKDSSGLIDQTLGTIENLYVDNEAANAKKQEFRDRANTVAQKINSDPANYMKYAQDLTSISRDLQYEMDNGILAQSQKRFTASNKISDDLANRKDVSSTSRELYLNAINKNEKEKGGLAFQDENNYREFNSDFDYTDLYSDFDEVDVITKMNTAWENDKDLQAWASANKGYINSGSKGKDYIAGSSVEKAFEGILDNNDFEKITQQRVFLEMYNRGEATTKDDPAVLQEVKRRKDQFIQGAVEKIAFKQDISTRQKHGDNLSAQKHIQNLNNVGKATQKYDSSTEGDKEVFNNTILKLTPAQKELVGSDVNSVRKYLRSNFSNEEDMIKHLSNNTNMSYDDATSFVSDGMGKKEVYEETYQFVNPDDLKGSEEDRKYQASLYNSQDGHIAKEIKTLNSTESNDKIIITVDGISEEVEGKSIQEAYSKVFNEGGSSIGISSMGTITEFDTKVENGVTLYAAEETGTYHPKELILQKGGTLATKQVPVTDFDAGKPITEGEVSFQQNGIGDKTEVVNAANYTIMDNGVEKIVTIEVINDVNNYDFDVPLNKNIISTFEK